MLRVALEALGRNGPNPLLEIELAPARAPHLAQTAARQQECADHRSKWVGELNRRVPQSAQLVVVEDARPDLLRAGDPGRLEHGARRHLENPAIDREAEDGAD